MAEKPNRTNGFYNDDDTYGSGSDFDHAPSLEEQLSSVNQNITTLNELQVLADLAEKYNSGGNNHQLNQIRKILKKSDTVYIDRLTENLDEFEKSQAAKLIATIIVNNPFLQTLSLEHNHFDKTDIATIIKAVVTVKSDPKAELQTLHLKGSVREDGISDIAGKLQLLRKKNMVIELDKTIEQHLTKKPTFFEKKETPAAASVPPQSRKRHNS